MIKGTTKSGFEFELEENAVDDYEFLEKVCEIDKGNVSLITGAVSDLLGEEQKERLKEYIRDEKGKVSIKRMIEEFTEILQSDKNGKN